MFANSSFPAPSVPPVAGVSSGVPAAPATHAGWALCRGARAAGEGCWGNGSSESGHGSSRAYKNTVSSAKQCPKSRQGRTALMHSAEMLAGRLLPPGNRSRERPARSCCSSPGHAAHAVGRCQSGDPPGTVTGRKGQKEQEEGLERLELPRRESTAGEGTHSSPRTASRGPVLFFCSWAGMGTPHLTKSKLGFLWPCQSFP